MPSSKLKLEEAARLGWELEELQRLTALGFGPDSALMSEPKLFIDSAFLGALQKELFDELGKEGAERALFHIGLIHGLRDASRISDAQPQRYGPLPPCSCLPLAIRFGSQKTTDGLVEVAGAWLDHFEADARLLKVGTSPSPTCSLSAGYTSGWLSGTLDRDVIAVERTCRAAGDECCTFVARDEATLRDSSQEYDGQRLSVAALRTIVCEAADTGASRHGHEFETTTVPVLLTPLDADESAVHIWGPVMIMPFTGREDSLDSIEAMGNDEALRGVRVIVLDLCNEVLDEGAGTTALESLIEDIQSQNVEVILTRISSLSQNSVAELQPNLFLSRKDLPEAIAYAFQIAEAQRHLL
jgi:hypothetical protein